MKNKIITLITIFSIIFLTSCTENSRARLYGGKTTIQLESNQVFKNITWKKDDMWILYKDTITNNYIFSEYSSFGILEGEVIIETKPPVKSNKTFKYSE